MTSTTNRIEQLGLALEHATDVVSGVRADQLTLPTPCHAFDVHRLAGHLLFAVRRAELLGWDNEAFTGPNAIAVERPPWPMVDAFRAAGAQAIEAWWAADLSSLRVLPWVTMSAGQVLDTYVMESVVHAWDLAAATGQPVEGDAALAHHIHEVAVGLFARLDDAAYGGDDPVFRRPTTPPPGVGPHSRLAALLGRDVDRFVSAVDSRSTPMARVVA